MTNSDAAPARRLDQLDGLRAVAALSVLIFHFTTRYEQKFLHSEPLGWGLDAGYLGVNLFFVISGFVIFMTIEAARTPGDFVFSRFSRLFPTYWAAVLATWALTMVLPLPGNVRSAGEVLANLSMVHEGFGVRSVDGAYWSLEVELIFYLWMVVLGSLGQLTRPHRVILGWVTISAVLAALARANLVQTPYMLLHYGLIDWIPWFALGMLAYLRWRKRSDGWPHVLGLALACLAIGLRSGWVDAGLGAVAYLLVDAASRSALRPAGWRPLVFVGTISYPLYLVHEQLGWLLIWSLEAREFAPWPSAAIALLASLLAAYAMHRLVERPSTSALRNWWRTRPPGSAKLAVSHHRHAIGAIVVLLMLAGGTKVWAKFRSDIEPPLAPLANWAGEAAACPEPALGQRRRVLLVLGQSNAASHAAVPAVPTTVPVFHAGRCALASDPLPGTSGSGASLWTALVPRLQDEGWRDPVIVAPLAVGGTRIAQWVDDRGSLTRALDKHLADLQHAGLRPDAVLWQQGEADMLVGTEARDYLAALLRLRSRLDAARVTAPMLVALSGRCRTLGAGMLQRLYQRHGEALRAQRIFLGPDTDAIGPDGRSDGCHFNAAGRERAAALWADSLRPLRPAASPEP